MKKKVINSVRTPVYRDAGFDLYDAQTAAYAFSNELSSPDRDPEYYIYSRYRNPTVVAAEEDIMNLEGSSWSLLSQTGMSAIDIALSIFQFGKNTRPWMFFSEIYGGTISYVEEILKKRRGIDARYFYPAGERYDTAEFEKVIQRDNPEVVYIESVANPMLIVPDGKKIINIAAKNGARVIVDNTFATPMLWKPLYDGADLVIYSATKYFSGHGNLTAGVVCGNDPALFRSALDYRRYIGHMLSPDDAYRLQTQMKTLRLRFGQHNANASLIASYLEGSEKISRVLYPGLKDHPTHKEAAELFGGRQFGGMITFDLAGHGPDEKRRRRDDFIKNVSDRIKLVPTLGDPSTILLPVEPVWGAKYPEPGMIRLSAGLEEPDEILSTIKKGIDSVK